MAQDNPNIEKCALNKKAASYNRNKSLVSGEKLCINCKIVHPLTFFSKDVHKKFGVCDYCRVCYAARRGRTFGERPVTGSSLTYDPAAKTKECPNCEVRKKEDDFYKDTSNTIGLSSWCKECSKERQREFNKTEESRERSKHYYKNRNDFRKESDKFSTRLHSIKSRGINITKEEYKLLFEKSGGVCAICGQAESIKGKTLSLDHDHATGQVRGFLCGNCNKALGIYKDDIEILNNVVKYLQEHGT